MSESTDTIYKEVLIKNVKKEVKQIMEEAVTKRFVNEDSSSVTSLCAAVESCLSHGLKRRALGLFKTSSTTALLHKVAKNFDQAAIISKRVQEIENLDPNRKSSNSNDGGLNRSVPIVSGVSKPSLSKKSSSTTGSATTVTTFQVPRYLWIRLALFEKMLAKIIDHLVQNSSKYYEKDALVADPDYGSILSSLLVGPCALDYSKTKSIDHFWHDPSADELVQRHKISSSTNTPPTCRKVPINFRRTLYAVNSEDSFRQSPVSAKDYVESLHQNHKATLLYGKNNVLVLPKDLTEPLAGYLSLHQSATSLIIKWTPNQLMNGHEEECVEDKSKYWDYALQVNFNDIVYVHCHQLGEDNGGTVVLVGQDGVQRPPIHFPKGGHLLAFLSCLENGLLPHGQLDPPLWPQRGKGKVLPKIRKRARGGKTSQSDDEESVDYVFQIINKLSHKEFLREQGLLDPDSWSNSANRLKHYIQQRSELMSLSNGSTSSSKSFCSEISKDDCMQEKYKQRTLSGESLNTVCETMKRQILSRAFYGWLAYCRHLKTVRTHLSGLVNVKVISGEEAEGGVTKEFWESLQSEDGRICFEDELHRRVYYGGIQHEIRKQVWPFLLGFYSFDSTEKERQQVEMDMKHYYETTMTEWLAVEAIVRQKDKEVMDASIAKLSNESTANDPPPLTPALHNELSNDVFEDTRSVESDDYDVEVDELTAPVKETMDKGDSPDEGLELECEENVCKEENERGSKRKNTSTSSRSQDSGNQSISTEERGSTLFSFREEDEASLTIDEEEVLEEPKSTCVSPASSQGGIYTTETLETFGLNVHRIDKDVQRCDRNYWYFNLDNLEKLRNIMCTYVWEHLDMGYKQGMCDLVAPLLVIFDDEPMAYACFCRLMQRLATNFPYSGEAMDMHFANMRSLMQILDAELFELMDRNRDYTHFFFCYRWFLLDFKRELLYDDVFTVWEIIWSSKHVTTCNFYLFFALALVETYRDVLIGNQMEFTEIIKFFNDMAERHDVKSVLSLARDLVVQLHTLIEDQLSTSSEQSA